MNLPDEIILRIFDNLPFYILQTMSFVCSRWNQLTHDNHSLKNRLLIIAPSLSTYQPWYQMMILLRKLCFNATWAIKLVEYTENRIQPKPAVTDCPFCKGMLGFFFITQTIRCDKCLLIVEVRRSCEINDSCNLIVDRESKICFNCYSQTTWCWACERFTDDYTGLDRICLKCWKQNFRQCSVCDQDFHKALLKQCNNCPEADLCLECECPCEHENQKFSYCSIS